MHISSETLKYTYKETHEIMQKFIYQYICMVVNVDILVESLKKWILLSPNTRKLVQNRSTCSGSGRSMKITKIITVENKNKKILHTRVNLNKRVLQAGDISNIYAKIFKLFHQFVFIRLVTSPLKHHFVPYFYIIMISVGYNKK